MRKKSKIKLFSLLMICALLVPEMGQVALASNHFFLNKHNKKPVITLPPILRSTISQFGYVTLSSFQDEYTVTPLFTGLDFSIHLNGSDLLDYGVANTSMLLPTNSDFKLRVSNFLSSLNGTDNVLSVVITINSFENSSMMYSSAYRNFLDIALEWASTTSDVFLLLANDEATPTNMLTVFEESQRNLHISEVNVVILTHGVFVNTTHGLMMWNYDTPIIVPPSVLYELANGKKFEKLNFVFLPFCSMEDEYSAFGNDSIKSFFLNLGASEVIGGSGSVVLDVSYLSWVQDVLLGGYWSEEYSYVEVPVFELTIKTFVSI